LANNPVEHDATGELYATNLHSDPNELAILNFGAFTRGIVFWKVRPKKFEILKSKDRSSIS
jgi:hypothetical protein